MDFATITKLLLDLGVVGVLGAFLFYIFYAYLPGLQKDFKEAMAQAWQTNKEQQLAFLETLTKERHAHVSAMQSAVASNVALEKSIDRLTSAIMGNRAP